MLLGRFTQKRWVNLPVLGEVFGEVYPDTDKYTHLPLMGEIGIPISPHEGEFGGRKGRHPLKRGLPKGVHEKGVPQRGSPPLLSHSGPVLGHFGPFLAQGVLVSPQTHHPVVHRLSHVFGAERDTTFFKKPKNDLFGPNWVILSHFWPYLAVFDYFWPFWPFLNIWV